MDNEGNIINDPKQKANLLNDYLNNIGNDLEQLLPKGNDPMSFVHNDVLNSMFLSLTNDEEIYNLINRLRKKSPGPDGIISEFLIEAGDAILLPLLDLYNQVKKSKQPPKQWNAVIITIIYKNKGSRKEMVKWTPVSSLKLLRNSSRPE